MSRKQQDMSFVAVKIVLYKDGKFLVMKDNFGDWDLPGGRLLPSEFTTPLADVVTRKIQEELGENVQYTLGRPVVHMRHERVEQTEGNPTVRIFAVGYEAVIDSGEIQLSSRHTEMMWADPKTFAAEKYFTGGWLEGVQEYQSLQSDLVWQPQ